MKSFVRKLFKKQTVVAKNPENLVGYSINKYKDTYKWLEDYDQGTKETAKILADTRIVQDALRRIQERTRI